MPTYHRAKHYCSVAIGLHMLFTEGFHHIGIRLQEELCELLANQVMAAVPKEPASIVVGNQDLKSRRGERTHTSPAAPHTPGNKAKEKDDREASQTRQPTLSQHCLQSSPSRSESDIHTLHPRCLNLTDKRPRQG
jgi:hypothetical protein